VVGRIRAALSSPERLGGSIVPVSGGEGSSPDQSCTANNP